MSQAEQPESIDDLRSRIARMLDTLDQDAPIAATVTFKVKPAKATEFIGNADVLTAATVKMPGCKYFNYRKAISTGAAGDPIGYAINEAWESVRQFKPQWESDHLKQFQETVGDLVVEEPALTFYHSAGPAAGERLARVAKTGQTGCWDTGGQYISCAGTGQDGAIQAGAPWPVPRFTAHGNGTVTDKLTELTWLQDADHFGEVTWAQALKNAQGLASGAAGLTDGSAAGDWRLPNIRELESLIDYGTSHPILPAGHPFTNVKSSIYWAANTLAAAPTLGWMVTLGIGPTVFDLKLNPNRMWPVRRGGKTRLSQTGQKQCWDENGKLLTDCKGTGQDGEIQAGVPPPDPRFADNHDGTVTDRLTGLIWLQDADAFGLRTWGQALTACNSLGAPSHGLNDGSAPGDWRLPNIKEIESLVDYGNVGPSIPTGHPFSNVRPSSYWTSTSVAAAPTQAMFIILGVGPAIFENKEHPFFVWPVRDRRPAS